MTYRLVAVLPFDGAVRPAGKWDTGTVRMVLGFDFASRRFGSEAEARDWVHLRVSEAGEDAAYMPPVMVQPVEEA